MRTTRILMLSLAMGGAVTLAACGSDASSSGSSSATTAGAGATSAAPATTADTSSGGGNPYGPPATTSAASATTAAPAGGGTALAVGQANGKSVLVDGQGFALYLFTKDDPTPGKSACNGNCAAAWPPLTTDSATPALGAGLDAEDVTVITRDDGTKQIAFYGHPLYHFQGDTAAGDMNGQGSGGIWFLVDTEGNAVK